MTTIMKLIKRKEGLINKIDEGRKKPKGMRVMKGKKRDCTLKTKGWRKHCG